MKRPLCLLFLLTLPASATISYVRSAANWTGTSSTSCNVSLGTTGAGDMLAVWAEWQTSSGPNTVTITTTTDTRSDPLYSAVGPTVQSASKTAGQILYVKSIPSLGDGVNLSFSGNVGSSACVIVEYSGADINYPLDSVSEAVSSAVGNAFDSGTASPANANLLVFGAGIVDSGSGAIIPGTGFTNVQSSAIGTASAITEQNTSAITTNSVLQRATACLGGGLSCNTNTGNWLMQMAVFRAASWTYANGSSSTRLHNVIYADQLPGIDIGDQVNHAYAALPANGGHIIISGQADGSCYSFSTPIVLNAAGKYVLLEYAGSGGVITNGAIGVWSGCLNYTGTGAAITLDYATSVTDSLSPIHGLKNIVLVNNFCAKTGCTSSATGILICGSGISGCTSSNRGIQSATMENVSVSGFSVGYQTQNFYSDPVLWINPHFFGNGTAWVVGNVSTQTVYGGFFTGNAKALATPTSPGNYDSEISFYGTTFVDNSSWDFDYGDGSTYGNNVCCAKLDLFGVHLEQYMAAGTMSTPGTHILQGSVDFLMGGGVAEDDRGLCMMMNCPDYWFNAQGGKLTLENVEIVGPKNLPTVGIVQDSASPATRVKVSGYVKLPAGLPCSSVVGGTGASTATVTISEGDTSTPPCTWVYESPQQFTDGISVSGTAATMTSGGGLPNSPCATGSIYTDTAAGSKSAVLYVCHASSWYAVSVP